MYESSFHCSDRSARAVAVGKSASWNHRVEDEAGAGEVDGEAGAEGEAEHGGEGDNRQKKELANELCWMSSTGKQIEQYQAHRASARSQMSTFQVYAFFVLVCVGMAVITVGSVGLAFMWYTYHVRHASTTLSRESLCSSVSIDSYQNVNSNSKEDEQTA
jgi:hypothetical protein